MARDQSPVIRAGVPISFAELSRLSRETYRHLPPPLDGPYKRRQRRIDWPMLLMWTIGIIPFCFLAWIAIFAVVRWLL